MRRSARKRQSRAALCFSDYIGRGHLIGPATFCSTRHYFADHRPQKSTMASLGNQQQTFPTVPPSFSAGGHEMRDDYAVHDEPRPSSNQSPYLTPYLGLRARLSQIWINRWTILLLLVLARTLIAIASLDDGLYSARKQALSACTSVESTGSAMASMPHYMSQGVNELTAKGVERAVNGLYSMVGLTITGVEELVIFIIGLLTNTYLCLITFAVSGSLHAALDLVKEVTDFLNKTLPAIGSEVNGAINTFDDGLSKFLDSFNNIGTIFGAQKKPKLDVNLQLDKLNQLTIPSDFTDKLNKLNASIPNFAEVKNATETVLRLPFEELKKLVNKRMGTYNFNRTAFPVPQKEKLSFCSGSNGINDFFDNLVGIAHVARKVFIVVLLLGAIAACVPMAYREIRRWRKEQERAKLVAQQSSDPMDVIYLAPRPYSSSFGIWLANRHTSVRNQTIIRWVVAYATSVPALFVLSLGIAGLFACLCQYILLKSVEKEVPALTNQVGEFAGTVVKALNNASQQWAIGTNKAIAATNKDINEELLGWVQTSTSSVNNTLNVFVDEMSDALNKVFGGTPLEDPIKEVLNCLIGLKIQGVQKALTWVHDNAQVNFPLIANDTFSLGAAKSISGDSASSQSFLNDPTASAKDEISDAVISLILKIEKGIRTEALISLFILLIWVFIFLIGLGRGSFMFLKPSKGRAEGGQRYATDPSTENMRVADTRDLFNFARRPEPQPEISYPRPMSAAPPYEFHKAPANLDTRSDAPYALNPHPFAPSSSSANPDAILPAPSTLPVTNEKMGNVGVRNVGNDLYAPSSSSTNRKSSHANVFEVTPVDEKSAYRNNPFR